MITNQNAHEVEVHKFSAFASDLGLKPGEWPASMQTTLGNNMPLTVHHMEVRDEDLVWVDYRQMFGCILVRVFND